MRRSALSVTAALALASVTHLGTAAAGPDLPVTAPTQSSAWTGVRIAATADSVCDPRSASYNGGIGRGAECRAARVVSRIAAFAPNLVLLPGDAQYEQGTLQQYRTAFAPAYADVLGRVRAVPGNHDYRTANAAGFKAYFADRLPAGGRTWYSMDRGPWHIVALDSNCPDAGGCGPTSPQGRWLAADLAASDSLCTIAYWHHPLRSSGPHGGESAAMVRPLWDAVARAGVDIVLNGHDHLYERFAKLDGIRAFTVGAGGKDLYPVENRLRSSRFVNNTAFGALILDLRPNSYSWRYVTAGGAVIDSGSSSCS